MRVFATGVPGWPGSSMTGSLDPPALQQQDTDRWLRLREGGVLDNDMLPGIIALAGCVDPDPQAVREWFHDTPIHPHGRTAMQLVQAGQGSVVIAFLQRVLADPDRASGVSGEPPVSGAAY